MSVDVFDLEILQHKKQLVLKCQLFGLNEESCREVFEYSLTWNKVDSDGDLIAVIWYHFLQMQTFLHILHATQTHFLHKIVIVSFAFDMQSESEQHILCLILFLVLLLLLQIHSEGHSILFYSNILRTTQFDHGGYFLI